METSALEVQTSILGNIGLYSYGTALLAYALLTGLAFYARSRNPLGHALWVAALLTTFWAGSVTVSGLLMEPATALIAIVEVARNAGWIFVLLRLVGMRLVGTDHPLASTRWTAAFAAGCAVALAVVLAAGPFAIPLGLGPALASNIAFSTWLGMAILGILLLEQYFRNSNEHELWATKHLCMGLGMLFAYDFFMYAEALLFGHLDRSLWQARGVVITMAAVLMAVSTRRTDSGIGVDGEPAPGLSRSIYLSRHVAFHSLTLLASGIYLICMALAAYFIRYLGGSWGGVLQIAFLCAAALVLVVLLFSGQIRARTRVWLSKNFFSYKYDYRTEWLQFTQTLASGGGDIPMNITRAIANLSQSPAGILWGTTDTGHFTVLAHLEAPHPGSDADMGNLPRWLREHEWIIDLREWRRSPDIYQNLELPRILTDIPRAWLIIPLVFGERVQGILLLKESELLRDLNWEDRDLLKLAGRQAASHLAQFQADRALLESRQFEAFNRLSAYVIHDLKNILAQLSLIVSNAEKHKQNPVFIDDMIDTVSNAVARMTRLMAQLRGDTRQAERQQFDLVPLLEEVVAECGHREPAPDFASSEKAFPVNCDRDRMHAVFGHLIHNAQEATGKLGFVHVRFRSQDGYGIVEIEDDGEGMDEDFVQQRLFKPFDSTKGLTGMGIGAFESRDFIRSLGGDIGVQSAPGEGSLFSVKIPGSGDDSDSTGQEGRLASHIR